MNQADPHPSGRYLCVHGHFYQPPRENPWLEMVETQDSAAPYHDWNERITAECYATNGSSRILNRAGQIVRIVNNYAQMSFNFGPTLLSWMKEQAPLAYKAVLDADLESRRRFNGHGSAVAQVFNHIIMPLASDRDKRTQIAWGIADFESRFGRKPEGMWLAETAVDTPTLELLAEYGILYTILAPNQCAAVHPPVEAETGCCWRGTHDDSVDTRRPYRVRLRSGRSIAVFFYDGPRSRAIAFERLLDSGEGFARRLTGGFDEDPRSEDGRPVPQLAHVATDGESYGHHHRFGEMALSYALAHIEEHQLAKLTNYGEYLEMFPPAWEARINEETSWSCAHGVERWRSDCGCNGGKQGWNQRWRAPLRDALDTLRDALLPLVREAAKPLLIDLDEARNAYISVMLDREQLEPFLAAHSTHTLSPEERRIVLKLMELERHEQLMYTSCGWFFDDIAGIETVQIIAYASRALQLAGELFGARGEAIEAQFIERLADAHSNVPEEGSGATIYRRRGRGLQVGLEQVTAHYAISSIFSSYAATTDLFAYRIKRLSGELINSGRGRLLLGDAEVISRFTEDSERVRYAVLHFGDLNIAAVVKRYDEADAEECERFVQKVREAMAGIDLPGVIRLFDSVFGSQDYSIRSLFADEQRRVVKLLLAGTLTQVEEGLLHMYEEHAPLLHFLSQTEVPRPPALDVAASFAINVKVRRALESEPLDLPKVRAALALAASDHITLDVASLNFVVDQRMTAAMRALRAAPRIPGVLEQAVAVARVIRDLPFAANIWQAQNLWYEIWNHMQQKSTSRRANDRIANEELFAELGTLLSIATKQLPVQERVGATP
jgi:alpha-amylase/alpha-mannosidase (GH57 family)